MVWCAHGGGAGRGSKGECHTPLVRIEHAVPDFERWKQAFDSDPADRKRSGVRRYQLARLRDDPNYVMIDLDFDTNAEAEAFLQNMNRIWRGPGQAIANNPRARIADVIEARDI
jgi:hypothetical protein